jgi:hypothetical protein
VYQEAVALNQRWPLGHGPQQNSLGCFSHLEGCTGSQTHPLTQWLWQNDPARFVEMKLHAIDLTIWHKKWHTDQSQSSGAGVLLRRQE